MSVVYATADELRVQLGLDVGTFGDTAAEALILEAEDFTDELLGGWPIDETTGRKIVQANVDAWQWSKLHRAVLLLAVELYGTPTLLQRPRYRREKGPDFEFEDPLGGGILSRYLVVLNDSGLRRIAGRARPGLYSRNRANAERFMRATRHDGT